MPGVQLQLGYFLVTRGDLPAAEAAYREALYLNPQLVPAYLNLADLLRAQVRDDEARKQLLQALEIAPDNGDYCTPWGCWKRAARSRRKPWVTCAERQSWKPWHPASLCLRHRTARPGTTREGCAQLQGLLREVPRKPGCAAGAGQLHAELGQRDKALGYARTLTEIAPGNQNYQQLYQQLRE